MEYNDYELIYMIRENDLDKETILKKYKPVVEKYAKKYYGYVSSKALDIEDLIQEGFIALNKAIDSYNEESSLFYTFACLCIQRHIYNSVRRINKLKTLDNNTYSYNNDSNEINYLELLDADIPSPFFNILDASYQNRLVQIKNNLNPLQGAIFELRYNGFSHKEIATLLDINIYYVRSAISRIRKNFMFKRFRELLKENY